MNAFREVMILGLLFAAVAARPLSEDEKVLHKAAAAGDVETVKKQLAIEGVNPDAPEPTDGATPLMIATGRGQFQVVKALIDGGAYIRAVDNTGRTALMVACHAAQPHIVALFLKKSRKVTHLVNEQSKEGWTALMIASLRGYDLMVKQLLNAGAEVNLQRNDGWTALMFTASEDCADGKRPDNCKKANTMLLEAGAKIDLGATDPEGKPNHFTARDLMAQRAAEEKEKRDTVAKKPRERTDL